jgi:hypothetical protein
MLAFHEQVEPKSAGVVVNERDPVAVSGLNGGRLCGSEYVAVYQLANVGRPCAVSLFLARPARLAEDARFTFPSSLLEVSKVGNGDTRDVAELD